MSEFLRHVRPTLICLGFLGCLAGTQAAADFPASRLESLSASGTAKSSPRTLAIKGWKTPAGTKVLFIRTTELPMFDVHVSFPAGSAHDDGKPGLAAATFSMLNEGVPGKDVSAILETFDGLGAQMNFGIDHERSHYTLRSLSDAKQSAPALQLFAQMLGEPLLSEEALQRMKNDLQDQLNSQAKNPGYLAKQQMQRLLIPQSPYASPIYGSQAGLQALTRSAVQDFHRQFYSARHAQITLVGDLSVEQAQRISLQISNALPTASAANAPVAKPQATGTEMSRHIEWVQDQTHMLLGQFGLAREHPDYPALHTANMIFGGGSNSRLMAELRQKRGLVYGAYSDNDEWAGTGLMTISLQIGPHWREATQALIESMLHDYLRDGPTQQELDQYKRYLTNTSALTSASNQQILARLVEINRHNLPLDLDFAAQQAQRLALSDIKAALNNHLAADKWRVVTVGKSVEQKPLPEPIDTPNQSMCRADAGFVAS